MTEGYFERRIRALRREPDCLDPPLIPLDPPDGEVTLLFDHMGSGGFPWATTVDAVDVMLSLPGFPDEVAFVGPDDVAWRVPSDLTTVSRIGSRVSVSVHVSDRGEADARDAVLDLAP